MTVLLSVSPSPSPSHSLLTPCAAPPRALRCGTSIGVGPLRRSGTLGAFVTDAAGTRYGLTNNHVIAACGHLRQGQPIVSPGPNDQIIGNADPRTIGHHARALPLVPGIPGAVDHRLNADAAIFRLAATCPVSTSQGGHYDTPARMGALAVGQRVEKVGRSTGRTSGEVVFQSLDASAVKYDLPEMAFSARVYFPEVYFVAGLEARRFADKGDSGALVVTTHKRKRLAVGLLIAVEDELAYVVPLEPVLERLAVTLLSNHHDPDP